MEHRIVREHYAGLGGSCDLKTSACCGHGAAPDPVAAAIQNIHPEVAAKFFGCGLVAPEGLRGLRVLDLGCGAGRDVYMLAQLVGPDGHVTGLDMTPELLDIARATQAWHAERFGYANTSFVEGKIEEMPVKGPFDVIVSNCVINLVPDKAAVLARAHDTLAEGGEFYFSDVYAEARVPEALRRDPVLWGECVSGALYRRDFLALARAAGFAAPRRVASRPYRATDATLAAKIGDLRFVSETWRLVRLAGLEPTEEDYGDVAEGRIALDETVLEGRHPVSRNTALMLGTRLGAGATVTLGDRHLGPFPSRT